MGTFSCRRRVNLLVLMNLILLKNIYKFAGKKVHIVYEFDASSGPICPSK